MGRKNSLADFWDHVDLRGADECWPWRGKPSSSGYGRFSIDGQERSTHVLAWELEHDLPVPAGLQIDHRCRQRMCCNPRHLEAVTQRINILRGTSPAAINATKTHCSKGHELTSANTLRRGPHRRKRLCRTCRDDYQRAWHAAHRNTNDFRAPTRQAVPGLI